MRMWVADEVTVCLMRRLQTRLEVTGKPSGSTPLYTLYFSYYVSAWDIKEH